MFHNIIFMLSLFEIPVVLCGTHKTNRRLEVKQHNLDYLYNDWSFTDRFSHPQYDSEVNITMLSPSEIPVNSINPKEDEKAKLVRFQITKYALNLFKVMANRSIKMSRLDLKKDLNYTEGQNLNEFIVKWYLKKINNTRGDIFLTKVKSNETVEVRGKELNNLIIDLLNKKLSKNITTETKATDPTQSPVDETLRNLKNIKPNKKENVDKVNKIKIDINKLNTTNYEYLMLMKIKENYKNKKYDDPYINLSDIDRESGPNVGKPTPYPGRQYPATLEHPGLDQMVFPHPNEYPPIPGRPPIPPNPGEYPPHPVHPGTNYPPPNPRVPEAFPSPEEMGIEQRSSEPGYTATQGIPGPTHGQKWTPPLPYFGPPVLTPRPFPGEPPDPTTSPSVHADPDRPFGSLLHHNPRPITTTEDPFVKGLLQDMQTQSNGYLSSFFIKLFELIAVKKKEHARPLIRRLEPILTRLHDQRQLITFGEPLTTKLLDIARLTSSAPVDVIQSHAATAYYALTHRKTYLSAEINGIIDYADSLYNDIEGRRLLKTLQDVKQFPNTTKTEKKIADEILDEALLAPYRLMTGTHKLQVLFDSINTAIIKRFHGRRRNVDKKIKKSTMNRNMKEKSNSAVNSDYSFEERDFKSKVNDVLLHGNKIQNVLRIGRKSIVRPKNKINYFSSYSDEEGVLKRNIYKVFNDIT